MLCVFVLYLFKIVMRKGLNLLFGFLQIVENESGTTSSLVVEQMRKEMEQKIIELTGRLKLKDEVFAYFYHSLIWFRPISTGSRFWPFLLTLFFVYIQSRSVAYGCFFEQELSRTLKQKDDLGSYREMNAEMTLKIQVNLYESVRYSYDFLMV